MNRRDLIGAGTALGASGAAAPQLLAAQSAPPAETRPASPRLDAPPEGYPGDTYGQPRRMGQFNWMQIAGFTVLPEDQVITRSYFGLSHRDTWLDAFLVGASGTRYGWGHDLCNDGSGKLTPRLMGPGAGHRTTPSGRQPDDRYGAWKEVGFRNAGDRLVYTGNGGIGREEVSFGASDLKWSSERGEVHLAGPLAAQGTQWRHAWRRVDGETGEMFYNHQYYSVEGAYFGEPVSGHILVETMWGNENYVETWFVRNRVGHWATFVTEYEDGAAEHGQIFSGAYGATGAAIVDRTGREILCTTNVNVFEESNGDIRYEMGGGQTWRFKTDPSQATILGRTRLNHGVCARAGETRKVVKASASWLTPTRLIAPRAFA